MKILNVNDKVFPGSVNKQNLTMIQISNFDYDSNLKVNEVLFLRNNPLGEIPQQKGAGNDYGFNTP